MTSRSVVRPSARARLSGELSPTPILDASVLFAQLLIASATMSSSLIASCRADASLPSQRSPGQAFDAAIRRSLSSRLRFSTKPRRRMLRRPILATSLPHLPQPLHLGRGRWSSLDDARWRLLPVDLSLAASADQASHRVLAIDRPLCRTVRIATAPCRGLGHRALCRRPLFGDAGSHRSCPRELRPRASPPAALARGDLDPARDPSLPLPSAELLERAPEQSTQPTYPHQFLEVTTPPQTGTAA